MRSVIGSSTTPRASAKALSRVSVFVDVQITLGGVAELGAEMDHATRLVVVEGVQLAPGAEGDVIWQLDDIIEVVGDGVVYLEDDSDVHMARCDILLQRLMVAVNVVVRLVHRERIQIITCLIANPTTPASCSSNRAPPMQDSPTPAPQTPPIGNTPASPSPSATRFYAASPCS